jgi:homocysteine S-methyltransferase
VNPIYGRGLILLDGGLATELERRGHDLSDELWSARLLIDEPDEIRAVHEAFVEAGAECVITASYQASVEALRARGADPAEILLRSVELARGAPLVAASVGPYGAALADGSEYTGDYGDIDLAAWHAERFAILDGSAADLLACETLPSLREAEALAGLLDRKHAWFSFSCRDGRHISDGTPIRDCAAFLDRFERVAAIGVNCTAPRFVESLIGEVKAATSKPIVVYPNSGERYADGSWTGSADPFDARAPSWIAAGASLIGGCCRTTPPDIRYLVRQIAGLSG